MEEGYLYIDGLIDDDHEMKFVPANPNDLKFDFDKFYSQMEKKFVTPLAIAGPEHEMDMIIPKLIELGYKWGDPSGVAKLRHAPAGEYPILVTQYHGKNGQIGYWDSNQKAEVCTRASRVDLILALAAMTEGPEFHVGEYAISKDNPKYGAEKISAFHSRSILSLDGRKEQHCHSVNYRKATKEEIIEHFNKDKTMDEKIIGYKWKPGAKALYDTAAMKITASDMRPLSDGLAFQSGSMAHDLLDKAAVVDLWFDPVYKPVKPLEHIVALRCSDGHFNLKVSKKGIFYEPDNTWLSIPNLKEALKPKNVYATKEGRGPETCYQFTPTTIDSGCKKGVPVDDWEKVLKLYNDFQDEPKRS